MEKLIALNETAAVSGRECNKTGCNGCLHQTEGQKPDVVNVVDNNMVNILQLYYAALIQCHVSPSYKAKQDAGYLHCT